MKDRSTHSHQETVLQNEVLTVKEVAAYLRVSRVTVWRLCQQGTLPALRVGRNWRICRNDLLDFLGQPQPSRSTPLDSVSTRSGDGRLPVTAENGDRTEGGSDGDSDEADF